MSAHRGPGRVEHSGAFDLNSQALTTNFGNDSVSRNGQRSPRGRTGYVTRTRLETIRGKLNRRQWAILEDVSRLGVVTGRQIQRVHYRPSTAASRKARSELAEMINLKVLSRLGRTIGGVRAGSVGWVYSPGIAGQRLLKPERSYYKRPWTPTVHHLAHALAVSELFVQLKESERAGAMKLARYDTEPACWRPLGSGTSSLKPDAFAVLHIGDYEDRIFIEQDQDTESSPRIATKAKTYIRYWQTGREQTRTGVFPLVLWITPNQDRMQLLIDVLAALPAEHWQLFMVTTSDRAAEQLASGTTEPITNERSKQ